MFEKRTCHAQVAGSLDHGPGRIGKMGLRKINVGVGVGTSLNPPGGTIRSIDVGVAGSLGWSFPATSVGDACTAGAGGAAMMASVSGMQAADVTVVEIHA